MQFPSEVDYVCVCECECTHICANAHACALEMSEGRNLTY